MFQLIVSISLAALLSLFDLFSGIVFVQQSDSNEWEEDKGYEVSRINYQHSIV